MRIKRFVAIFFPTFLVFSLIIYKEVRGEEKEDIKKQIQELRQQMEIMQRKLDELEEKNKKLEEEAQRQKEEKEIERAITEAPSPSKEEGALQRIVQSLNPDISLIGTFSGAYFSTDDPIVHTDVDPEKTGINLQEVEFGVQAAIDPYFRADAFFALRRDEFEIEEAYFTSLATLPLNLQIRGGLMRSKFGRINLQHREFQDFVTVPLVSSAFLGEHLNPVGVEFNFLLPLSWFAELSTSVNSPDGLETTTFARDEDANNIGRLLYIAHLSNFFEISDALSLNLGGSFATGSNGTERGNRSNLYGVDLFLKYRPLRDNPYQEAWLQSEFIYRQAETPDGDLDDWGAYGQLIYRFAKRWNAGVRFDFVDTNDPISPLVGDEEGALGLLGKELRYTAALTFNPTEFSRIRLEYQFDDPDFRNSFHAVFLQFQYSIGAHGAHPF